MVMNLGHAIRFSSTASWNRHIHSVEPTLFYQISKGVGDFDY